MRMSDNGRKLLMEWEGYWNDVYIDSGGAPTIGVGHLLTKSELRSGKLIIGYESVKYHDGLTDAQVDILLSQDLEESENAVNSNVNQELNQDQFDALVSFVFNVGVSAFEKSTLLKCINNGDYSEVPFQLRRWNKGNGRVILGLVNRREKEIELWENS